MVPVHILGAGAAQGLATTIARHEGIALSGTFGAVGSILEKFLAGEACDILVLTHAQLAPYLEGELHGFGPSAVPLEFQKAVNFLKAKKPETGELF